MTGPDALAQAIQGPRVVTPDIAAYTGTLVQVSLPQTGISYSAGSATVNVGGVMWQINRWAGSFLAEVVANGNATTQMIGRMVRVFMVDGQAEIAYTIDPASVVETPLIPGLIGSVESRIADLDTGKVSKGSLVINIKDAPYSALGDGSHDDTTAIQAAIDAAGTTGTVYIPPVATNYKFSTLTVPGGVKLIGGGWNCYCNQAFGGANWVSGSSGSVLRSTATSGSAIAFTGYVAPSRAEGFAVIGPGSGTSTGIQIGAHTGNQSIQHYFQDVLSANFSTCFDLWGVESSTFVNIHAKGCHIGITTGNAFSQNTLVNTEVQFSDQYGIHLDNADLNLFAGGLVQNTSGTASLYIVTGELNTFQSFYHESAFAPTDGIFIAAGTKNAIRDWWFSQTAQITINGGDRNILDNIRHAAGIPVVANARAILMHVDGMTLTGSAAAICLVFDETTMAMPSSGTVRVRSGSKILLESTGTGSYIQRIGTGDSTHGVAETEIGCNTVQLSLAAIPVTTTGPAAGGADALPATPAGYVSMRIAGVSRKIAYY